MKTNISKCIWTACITAALSVCITMTASAGKPSNLGDAYISSVTSGSNCVANTINGGSVQFWDIQVGGTYTVTLTGVTDCASQGNESQIGVIVHNSTGGNLYYAANYVSVGVYSFTIKSAEWTGQCKTMPIEYCTHDARGVPANLPGTGKFATVQRRGSWNCSS